MTKTNTPRLHLQKVGGYISKIRIIFDNRSVNTYLIGRNIVWILIPRRTTKTTTKYFDWIQTEPGANLYTATPANIII